MSDRTFTLDEAQSLLPVLESLLRTAIDAKKAIAVLQTLRPVNGKEAATAEK